MLLHITFKQSVVKINDNHNFNNAQTKFYDPDQPIYPTKEKGKEKRSRGKEKRRASNSLLYLYRELWRR